jgi:DnaJ-class molecular chaperone
MRETKREYYAVLGVTRTEGATGMRAAYHDHARALHQGRADEEAQELRAVIEAYQALSDPRRRRRHDQALRTGEARQAHDVHFATRSDPAILPVAEQAARTGSPSMTIALLGDPESVTPSFEELHDRLMRNFTGYHVPKSEHVEPLNMELLLAPREARRGMTLDVRVPSLHTCPDCAGSGLDWGLPCVRCGESGMVDEEESVPVLLRAPVPPRGIREVPLERVGIRNVRLRFHVAVTS